MEEAMISAAPMLPEPRDHYNPMHHVNIRPLNYGFIVEVGCQTFAIERVEDLISKLSAYLTTPNEVAGIWMNERKLPA
jgi:hypothetical protein